MSLKNPALFLEEKIKKTPDVKILDKNLLKNLDILSNKIESHKGVYVCLIMLLVKKIHDPNQDIRNHKVELKNGFINDLSVLDLIFNCGPNSKEYM